MAGEPERLAEELMLAVTDLQNVTDEVDQAVSERLGLNRTDARCLAYLVARGPLSAGDLAALAGLAPSALTFAVDRLVKAGYAERARDDADRRRVVVKAAERTHRIAAELWGETVEETERQLAEYSPGQLRLLLGFVRDQVDLQRRQVAVLRDRPE
ncbi:MarR family transcriptional regulator [Amycolatopsis minnesotensis]|uniref:HTH marR-type domain-containing protein n=1 Tax=Amycolatopsis minnesotensis TaxID=337894 RepID=A0ABN2SN57_9PSEU